MKARPRTKPKQSVLSNQRSKPHALILPAANRSPSRYEHHCRQHTSDGTASIRVVVNRDVASGCFQRSSGAVTTEGLPAACVFLATSLIGLLDECIQAVLPNRVFDWRDILLNVLAALAAIVGMVALRWSRGWVESLRQITSDRSPFRRHARHDLLCGWR